MPRPRVDSEAVDFEAEKERNNTSVPGRRPSTSSSATATDKENEPQTEFKEDAAHRGSRTSRQPSVSAQLRNPLAGLSEEDVLRDVERFVDEKGLQDSRDDFRKGALLSRVINRPNGFEHVSSLSDEEREALRYEVTHRWSQPFMLYFLVVLCAGSAIVQGMDQTAVNGAQVRRDRGHDPLIALLLLTLEGLLLCRVWDRK